MNPGMKPMFRLTLVFFFLLCGLLINSTVRAANYQQPVNTQQIALPGAVHDILPLNAQRSLLAVYGEGVVLAEVRHGQSNIIHTARYSRQAEALVLSTDRRRVYVANGSGGIDILSLSPGGQMALLGRFNTPSYAFDVALARDNRTLYIADNSHGVIILDVSQPQRPRQLAHIPTQASSAGVTLSRNGHTLYIADQAHGIHIVDVRKPQQPRSMQRLKTSGQAQSTALSNNNQWLFSANNNGGLQVFSLRTPASPRLSASLPAQNAFSVELSAQGRTAFVADLFNGVQIIDVSNPARPRLIHTLRTRGLAEKVSLPTPNAVWVAEGDAGLSVLTFR